MKGVQKVLIVGFGDVGRRLARLIPSKVRVTALVRNRREAIAAKRIGVRTIRGDLALPHTLSRLAGAAELVFHFAPPPGRGRRDTHTRHLVSALAAARAGMLPQHLVYISTTGVYGDCAGEWIDEQRPLRPATARARRRKDAEQTLRAWARRQDVALSILRAPGIYARERLPLARLAQAMPVLADEDDVYTNHIHADDLARSAWQAAKFGKGVRAYNIVDDSAIKMGAYFDLLARHAGLPAPPRIGRAEAARSMPAARKSFMEESRRIRNGRMKRELRVVLEHPTVAAFLAREARERE